jgi:hypothetical protein
MISRATSSETCCDHPSAVLKATTRNRVVVLSGKEIGDRGFQIGPLRVGLEVGLTQRSEIIAEHDIDGLVCAVRHNRGGQAPTHMQLHATNTGKSKHKIAGRFHPESGATKTRIPETTALGPHYPGGSRMSDQTPDRENAEGRRPVHKWAATLWLVLLGVAMVAWWPHLSGAGFG